MSKINDNTRPKRVAQFTRMGIIAKLSRGYFGCIDDCIDAHVDDDIQMIVVPRLLAVSDSVANSVTAGDTE